MRTKKKSSGKIPEKKSAVPYKSTAPHRHKPSRPLQTVKLPKSQMPSRQTEEHQALLRTKYHKKRQRLKHIFRILVGVFVILAAAGGVFYGWNILAEIILVLLNRLLILLKFSQMPLQLRKI